MGVICKLCGFLCGTKFVVIVQMYTFAFVFSAHYETCVECVFCTLSLQKLSYKEIC